MIIRVETYLVVRLWLETKYMASQRIPRLVLMNAVSIKASRLVNRQMPAYFRQKLFLDFIFNKEIRRFERHKTVDFGHLV